MSNSMSDEEVLAEFELHAKYAPKSIGPYLRSLDHQGIDKDSVARMLPDWQAPYPKQKDEDARLDRALGCLVGLAIGDALGTTLEFQPRGSAEILGMQGGGVFNLNPGEWTDDTSMALCLGETYLSEQSYSTNEFMNSMVRWLRYGHNSHNGRCFDIGNTTRFAIESFQHEGSSWKGNSGVNTAGNAPAIRLAPVAIFRRNSFYETFRDADMQASATHRAQESIAATQLLSRQLHVALNGSGKDEVVKPHILPLPPKPMQINAGTYKNKSRAEIKSSGYIIDTLEAALWSVWNTDNFKDALLLAVNLADDADSVGAVAGQLAGALYGYSSIPKEWLDTLAWHDQIVEMATRLFNEAPEDGDWIYINPEAVMKGTGIHI